MRLRALLWALPAFLVWASLCVAQSASQIDYDAWRSTSERVERVIDLDRATDPTLERLRGEVAFWREEFLASQEDRSLRISTLERQLEALASLQREADAATEGDPASEPDAADAQAAAEEDYWIIQRRAEVLSELMALQVPNVRAAEAFAHADGLIRELDAMLRQRKTEVVFARGPTPLNPLRWTEPLTELDQSIVAIPTEIVTNLRDPEHRKELLRNLPQVLLLVVLGGFLLRRGRIWTASLSRSARNLGPPVISYPLQALILLVEIALPWFGLVMLLLAAETSGLFGEAGEGLLLAVRRFGLFAIVGTAFVRRLLPAAPDEQEFVALDNDKVRRARRLGLSMVYALALAQGLALFFSQVEVSEVTSAFVLFPFFVILGYLLFRFSRLFTLSQSAKEDDDDTTFSLRILDILARLGMLTGILSPLAAAAGLSGYAAATLMPATYTIFALGLAAFLGAWLKELYAAIKRRKVEESDLAPTLIGVMVYAALIPVLALIWGARVTDLTEVWSDIREGFSLGGVKISPTDIMTFLVVFSVLYGLTRLLQSALRVSILPKTKLDLGSRTAIVSGLGYIGVFVAAIVAIQSTGLDLSSLAIVAGALSVGIGFGLQTIVSNFVSGIILLIERPISEGDWIDVNGNQGYVRDISVRSTRIETFDRTDVIVPNSDLIAGTVTNWTRGKLIGRIIVPVGVAYGTDPARVERILREISEAHPMVLLSPPPAILFMRFGADALEFEIRAILRDVNFSLSVKSDLNHEIAKRLKEEEIEIPFAQRDLWLRNPEVLSDGHAFSSTGRHFIETPPEPRAPRPTRDEAQDTDGDADGDAR
ncbi:MAG: DUF3772 domain-containing protein [Pseudomonadota bacterium]